MNYQGQPDHTHIKYNFIKFHSAVTYGSGQTDKDKTISLCFWQGEGGGGKKL